MNNFLWLEQWFASQCDGTWEQTFGVEIKSLDPPGWHVRIALQGTRWDALPNAELKNIAVSERDWMRCRLIAGTFDGTGGPLMLGPIVQTFRSWIESQP